jgi:hypothetical protein
MGRRCVVDASPFRFIASQFGWVRFGVALSGSAHHGPPASLADPARPERRAGAGRGLVRHAAGSVIPPGVFPTGISARALAIVMIIQGFSGEVGLQGWEGLLKVRLRVPWGNAPKLGVVPIGEC